jgi:hypothetical protein
LFGASSTANGDVKDLGGAPERLPGTPAVAGSSASVTTSIFNDSQAITGVNFDRKFSLSGSPTGWNVQLRGALVGNLIANKATLHSKATVDALFRLDTGDPRTNIPLVWSFSIDGVAGNTSLPITIPMNKMTMLPDGVYPVTGFLLTTAFIDRSFSTGAASSEFAAVGVVGGPGIELLADGDEFSFTVSAAATPVPEPGSLVLIASAYAVGIGWQLRRLLKRLTNDRNGSESCPEGKSSPGNAS